jgi:hypothetical protein
MMPRTFLIAAISSPADAEIALINICEQEYAAPVRGKAFS